MYIRTIFTAYIIYVFNNKYLSLFSHPDVVQRLSEMLKEEEAKMVPSLEKPNDKTCNPKYWNYVWTNYAD